MSSLKQQILDADDLDLKPVKVKEWNITVYLKAMSLADGIRYQSLAKSFSDTIDDNRACSAYLSLVLCNEDGSLIFDSPEELQGKNIKVLGRLFNIALKQNRGTNKELEEAEKNS